MRKLFILIVGLTLSQATAEASDSKTGELVNGSWSIEQRFSGFSFPGFGGTTSSAKIALERERFHLAWKSSKAHMLVMKPDWKIRTWNDWHSDATAYSSFERIVKSKSTDHFLIGQHFEKGLGGTVAGLTATEYHTVPDNSKGPESGTTSDTTPSVSVWVANDIRISHQLSRLIHMLYAAPDLGLFPLSVRITDRNGKTVRMIETVSAKQMNFPASTFKLPPYRPPGKAYQPSLFLDLPL